MTGFQRVAESVAIYRAFRTSAPSTGDGSLAAHLSGVAVDRRDTDEGSDTTAVELTEFGQIGDEGVGGDIADTGNRGQQIVGGAPDW